MIFNIHEIFYNNIELLDYIDKAIIWFREGCFEEALQMVSCTGEKINTLGEVILKHREYFDLVSTQSVAEMLQGILEAKKRRDYILLADLLELQLANFICSIQSLILQKEELRVYDETLYQKKLRFLSGKIDQSIEKLPYLTEKRKGSLVFRKEVLMEEPLNPSRLLDEGYAVEYTTCGRMTVRGMDEKNAFYFHTNYKIGQESFLLARSWRQVNGSKYIVCGFGLGYHLKEFMELVPDARLEVYEADMNILKLSCAFSNIDFILKNPNVLLIFDPDYECFLERVDYKLDTEAVRIHYPSLRNVKHAKNREKLGSYLPSYALLQEC